MCGVWGDNWDSGDDNGELMVMVMRELRQRKGNLCSLPFFEVFLHSPLLLPFPSNSSFHPYAKNMTHLSLQFSLFRFVYVFFPALHTFFHCCADWKWQSCRASWSCTGTRHAPWWRPLHPRHEPLILMTPTWCLSCKTWS